MITIRKQDGRVEISRLSKGERLQLLLDKNERTPSWLARKLGVSHTIIHKWIQNKVDLKLKWITKINHLLNIDDDFWD